MENEEALAQLKMEVKRRLDEYRYKDGKEYAMWANIWNFISKHT